MGLPHVPGPRGQVPLRRRILRPVRSLGMAVAPGPDTRRHLGRFVQYRFPGCVADPPFAQQEDAGNPGSQGLQLHKAWTVKGLENDSTVSALGIGSCR